MQQLDQDLWVAQSPLRFFGLEVGARMTVVRLPNSKLFLHSPIAPTPELLSEVRALGEVAYLVAPNRFHHLFLGDWQRNFPNARAYAAPSLDQKRPDLKLDGLLSDEPVEGWAQALGQVFVRGFPFANEVVFFHRPSKTLIATDLAFNIGCDSPPLTRFIFRLSRTFGRLAPTLVERLLVRDRAAFRRSLEQIFQWPFERVVVAHGAVSERGGREELRQGYAWALRAEG